MDRNHLEQFNGKCSVLVSEETYNRRMDGKPHIGYPPDTNDLKGSMYVSTSDDIDKALKDCNGDISKLESSLGFPEGHFGDGPLVRVDINNPEDHGLRTANGKEAGANEFFNTKTDENGNLPNIQYTTTNDGRRAVDTNNTKPEELSKLHGQYIDQNGAYHAPNTEGYNGKTSGGMPEAVVNQVPNTAENISYTKIDGFKRGENSDLKTSQIKDGYSTSDEPNKINSQTVAAEKGGGANAPPAHEKSGALPTQTADPQATNHALNPKQEGDNFSQKNGQPPDPKQSNTDDLNNKKALNSETNGAKPDQTNGKESPKNTEPSEKNGAKPDQVNGKESPQNANAPEQSGAKPDQANQSGNEDNFKKAEPDASNTKAMDASPSNQPVANAPAENAPTPTPASAPKNAMGM